MDVTYIQITSGSKPPEISSLGPFRVIIIIEEEVTPEWQSTISQWLVKSGCLYMMAWGNNCSSWDDSVDYANLEEFNYEEIPKDKFVMTTWHENEPLEEVLGFANNFAFHPTINLPNTVILHIAPNNHEKEVMSKYADAQILQS
jgi:hypothetical protein